MSGAYLNNWRGVMGVTYPDGTPGSATDDTELRYYPDADRVDDLTTAATDAHHRFAIAQPKMLALRHAGAFAPSSGATFLPTALNPSGVKLLANVHRLGMGRTVSMSLDVPQVHLDRVRSMTGKAANGVYYGWDRFGRLKQQVWALTPTPAPTEASVSGQREFGWMQDTSSTPTYPEVRPVYQHAYSYSEDSDRLSDDDLRPTYGGGSGSGAAAPDRKYSYDNLRRLTKEEKGKFTWSNGSQSFASGVGSKSWSLDMLGNWKSVAEDADGNGSFAAAETSIRTHDAQNQLTSLGATTAGGGGTPEYIREYDKNGNLIWEKVEGDEEPTRRFIYDAWNRLVRVERGEGGSVEPSPVAAYTYNALNWRVTERVRWPGDPGAETSGYTRTRAFFFSSDWQVLNALEDRHAPSTSTLSGMGAFTPDSETQFMWGVRDKDELLQVRTRALTDANGVVHNPVKLWTDSGFVNTVYALTDAQMSVAGYVSASGRVRESRLYDSYGRMTRTLPGDLNGEGVCDDVDFGIFDTSYNLLDCSDPNMPGRNVGEGASPGNAPTWGCPADLNGDWVVDEVDFGIFAASYNQLVPDVDALVGATGSGNSSGGAMEWGPGWNGYWYDPATGLWLSRHRWYDPVGGRWITRDPAGYVDGLSLYLYVKGNPFIYRDPSGLDSWWISKPFYAMGMNDVGEFLDDFSDGAAEAWEYDTTTPQSERFDHAADASARQEVHEALSTTKSVADHIPIVGALASSAVDVVDKGLTVFDTIVDGEAPGQMPNLGPGQHPLTKPLLDLGESLVNGASKAEQAFQNEGAAAQPYEVDNANGLYQRSQVGDDLAVHHAGQAHAMEQLVPGYDRSTGPAITLPTAEHRQIPNVRGAVNGSPRDILANDMRNLRQYTNAPNSALKQLSNLNKNMYPQMCKP